MSIKQRCVLVGVLLGITICLSTARAQNTRDHSQSVKSKQTSRIVTLNEDNYRDVSRLVRGADALELDLTEEQLDAEPVAWQALDTWVREGGIVLLHTDAARAFGYTTVAARERTFGKAGQLFGRARNALYFGMHPLLWNGLSQSLEGSTFGAMGTRVVFYEMDVGDHFATSHPDGTPLLRVTDLSQLEHPVTDEAAAKRASILGFHYSVFRQPETVALSNDEGLPLLMRYAAAMAPYGKGWTFVVPRQIQTKRGDGERFLQNLDGFIRALRDQKTGWVGLPMPPLERAMERIKRGRRVDWARVAQEIREALESTSVEWSEDEVRAMYAKDVDQTLSPEDMKRAFNPQHWPVSKERETYMAIANALEGRKRRRFLGWAHSKWKIVMSRVELEEMLREFDAAAADQRTAKVVFDKLASEDDEEKVDAAGEMDAGATEDDKATWIELGEDERRWPSYRRAAGQVFLQQLHSDFLTGQRSYVFRGQILRALSTRNLNPEVVWLWRGLLSAASIDHLNIHAYGRRTYLNDAMASWQRALKARWQRLGLEASTDNNSESGAPYDAVIPAGGQSTSDAFSDRANDQLASVQATEQGSAVPTANLLQGEIAGVPCALIWHWINDGFRARTLIEREPPFGGLSTGVVALEFVNIEGVFVQTRHLTAGALNTIDAARGWVGTTYPWGLSGGQSYPQFVVLRGFLEDKSEGVQVVASLMGRSYNRQAKLWDTSGIPPLSDFYRAVQIRNMTGVLNFHSALRVRGWGTDTLDVMLFPGSYSAQAFSRNSQGILGNLWKPGNGAFDGRGTLGQVAGLSPIVSPLGVSRTLMLQSATEGRVVGTRLMLSTAKSDAFDGTDILYTPQQVRRSVGIPAAMARLYAQALLNTMLEGGNEAPSWMQDGFTNLCRMDVANVLSNGQSPAARFLAALRDTPTWKHIGDRSDKDIWWNSDADYFRTAAEIVLIDNPAQQPATRAMQALYRQYGTGGVTEIFQRLGAGQSADEAFEAVTGMSESECVAALSKAA